LYFKKYFLFIFSSKKNIIFTLRNLYGKIGSAKFNIKVLKIDEENYTAMLQILKRLE